MGKVYRIGDPPAEEKTKGQNPILWAGMGASIVLVAVAVVAWFAWPRHTAIVQVANPAPVFQAARASAPNAPASIQISGIPPAVWPPPKDQRNAAAPVFQPQAPSNQMSAVPQSSGYPGLVPGTPAPGFNQSGATPVAPATGNPLDVIARVRGSVVFIAIVTGRGEAAAGTGFVVAPGKVATCAHVINNALEGWVRTADGQRFSAHAGPIDQANDVTIITVDGQLPPALQLGSFASVREGEEIAATGYPQVFDLHDLGFALQASTTRGTVSAKRSRTSGTGNVDILQIDASINHGNSGGPVYSVKDGTVYGVAASMLSETQGLNFASSIDAVRRLLSR